MLGAPKLHLDSDGVYAEFDCMVGGYLEGRHLGIVPPPFVLCIGVWLDYPVAGVSKAFGLS